MVNKNTKNVTAITLLFSAILGLAFFVSKVNAGVANNVTGWLWGGSDTNLGWISMNNTNQAGAIDYGVSIPATDDAVTGFAWSENVGWIDFAPAGPYPTVVTGDDYPYATKRLGDRLVGWARIVSIQQAGANAGGWSGWIRLSSDASDPIVYGVDITKMDGTGANPTYAWSNEFGWIDFSGALIAVATPGACGDADTLGAYAATDSEWTAGGSRNGYACVGDSAVSTVSFPAEGATVTWLCGSVNCSGSRALAGCTPNGCELNTCVGETCDDTCETKSGTKNCTNNHWREVSPN
jgi:hypothetical protein